MLLGYKSRFAEPIQKGTKVHTMRKRRKIKPKIGETLYMYSGLRTKNTVKISDTEKLISKQKAWIKISFRLQPFLILRGHTMVCVDGRRLTDAELEQFVKFDGFESVDDFLNYWIDGQRKDINKKGWRKELVKIVESMDLYHWTDLKY